MTQNRVSLVLLTQQWQLFNIWDKKIYVWRTALIREISVSSLAIFIPDPIFMP
jgi:hypothetical protein